METNELIQSPELKIRQLNEQKQYFQESYSNLLNELLCRLKEYFFIQKQDLSSDDPSPRTTAETQNGHILDSLTPG